MHHRPYPQRRERHATITGALKHHTLATGLGAFILAYKITTWAVREVEYAKSEMRRSA